MLTSTYHALTRAPRKGAPLIFAFHGTGGDEHQFFDVTHQIAPDAGVITPRGDVSEMGMARYFRRTGEGVYDMEDLAQRTARMVAFVQDHKAAHPYSALYGYGYSNGANILASVMMARPDLFDRVGLLHPLIPWSPDPVDLSDRRLLITAGRRDPICPWPLSQRLIDWAQAQGAQVTTAIHDGGHDLRQPELVALKDLLTG
ncbi:Putative hydrolase MhqD [Marinibacterium anthonyi]|nr:Putative hydrolase MhqD [Marinibacterium anthonyi]